VRPSPVSVTGTRADRWPTLRARPTRHHRPRRRPPRPRLVQRQPLRQLIDARRPLLSASAAPTSERSASGAARASAHGASGLLHPRIRRNDRALRPRLRVHPPQRNHRPCTPSSARTSIRPDPWRHGPIDHVTLEAHDLDALITLRTLLHSRQRIVDRWVELLPPAHRCPQ
jgi:hypothetical protein